MKIRYVVFFEDERPFFTLKCSLDTAKRINSSLKYNESISIDILTSKEFKELEEDSYHA
jgi:hypothetical protein